MADLTDVAWDLIESPLGAAFAACTPVGLCTLHVDVEPEAAVARLERALGVRASRSPARLAPVSRELEAYFEGRLRDFSLTVDLRLVRSAFVRAVLFEAVTIPYGSRRTYGLIARDLGRPRSARAVGAALARNPVWIVVPCHRVVGTDGSLTGYAGGLERKRALLSLEEVGGLLSEAEVDADPRMRAPV